MESDLVTIGEVARRSGLTVSALRYYDEAGVLVPVAVDPASGYRFYSGPQVRLARLVARLRRVGMPVAGPLLDAHVERLDRALADARRELSAARALLDDEEILMSTTVKTTAAALGAALRAVRFAAGSDPELPAINGVLLDATPGGTWLVATDRFRLAIAPLDAAGLVGDAVEALLPTAWVDGILPLLAGDGEVIVTVTADEVGVRIDGASHSAARPRYDYPDYRRLVRDHGPGVVTAPGELRAAIEAAPVLDDLETRDGMRAGVALLRRDGDTIVVADRPGERTVAFDRGFLLEAVTAADGVPLTLALDGTPEPLVLRTADGGVGLLMPIALD